MPIDRNLRFIVTCEHARPYIPPEYEAQLGELLHGIETHRVYDWGARPIAKHLARLLKAPYFESEVSRLVIDLNRSIDNPDLLSEPIRAAGAELKQLLLARYYDPFREAVGRLVEEAIANGDTVFHFSIHSFTPNYYGQERSVKFGVLFDESREIESNLAQKILAAHKIRHPYMKAAFNEPYKGTADGHTTSLRQRYPSNYAGIELEYSQGLELETYAARFASELSDIFNQGH